MILDNLVAFESTAGITVTTGTVTSTNIVDLGVGFQNPANLQGLAIPGVAAGGGARDIGVGDDPALKLMVDVTAAPSGGTSLQIVLQGAPDNGSGQPGSFTTYATGFAVPTANITAGSRLFDIDIPRPPPGVAMPRYLQLQYVVVGTFSPGVTLRPYIVLDRIDQPVGTTGLLSGYVPGVTIAN